MMYKVSRFPALLVLLLCVPGLCLAAGPGEVRADDSGLCDRVIEFAEREMEELHTPGLGFGVVLGHTLVCEGYLGMADVESGRAVNEHTFFRIGSISKGFTATGLMQQREKGAFDLDEDVNEHLPERMIFPPHPKERPVTFRHLLTHTSGGGEFLSFKQLFMKGQGVQVEGDDYKPLFEYLKLGFHNKVDPGDKYAYSNYGYSFLGLALETMAGRPFHEYMEERVFERLGMEESTYRHDEDMLDRLVVGYAYNDKKEEYERKRHIAFGITPSGNVYTTVREFGLWVSALLNGGANRHGRVIEEDALEMMMSMQHTYDPRQSGYGFGFRVYGKDIQGHRIVGHAGSVPWGYTAQMLLAPDERAGVFVFANSNTHAPKSIAKGLLMTVLGIDKEPLPDFEPNPEAWPEITGLYAPRHRDFKTSTRIYMDGIGAYRVRALDGNLVLYGTWQGKKEARRLIAASADDPLFFRLEPKEGEHFPEYVCFKEFEGRMYIIPGGYERFVKLGPARVVRRKCMIPLGRLIAEINPF